MTSAICNEDYCHKKIDFNHVTVLYYMMDVKNRKINLKHHCDVEMTASDRYKESNSQEKGTPTVVLTLNDSKIIKIYKRYTVDGGKFE